MLGRHMARGLAWSCGRKAHQLATRMFPKARKIGTDCVVVRISCVLDNSRVEHQLLISRGQRSKTFSTGMDPNVPYAILDLPVRLKVRRLFLASAGRCQSSILSVQLHLRLDCKLRAARTHKEILLYESLFFTIPKKFSTRLGYLRFLSIQSFGCRSNRG